MEHRDIVLRLLVPADQNPTKPIQPTVRPLHYPTPRLATRLALYLLSLSRLRRKVGRETKLLHDLLRLGVVVTVIQTHVLRLLFARFGPLHRDALDRRADQLHVGPVGPFYRQAHRHAAALDQQAALDPLLGAVGGVFARLFPPPRAPWSCTRPCSATPSRCPQSSRIRATPSSRTPRRRRQRPTVGSGRGLWSRGRTWWRRGPSTDSRCGGRRRWHPCRRDRGCVAVHRRSDGC